ncbi:hypothetical protein EXIGLDRAFT_784288 [Exidia glandulosa HHB12029]|uniref:Uncharacterized protein n=1 Tax=Exidia glandulosa HHB12029 TaxID=1314781 RepID=A0A166MK02_EXIGL|nr:hypothetical protein EXIGLDRAFT_784288 [Exidia glandulosa HHB12029]
MLARVPVQNTSLALKIQLVAYRLVAALRTSQLVPERSTPCWFAFRAMVNLLPHAYSTSTGASGAVTAILPEARVLRVVLEVDFLESTRDVASITPPRPDLAFVFKRSSQDVFTVLAVRGGARGAVLELDLPVRIMLESDRKSLVECKDVLTLLVETTRLVPTTVGTGTALNALTKRVFTYRETRVPSFEVPRVAVVEIDLLTVLAVRGGVRGAVLEVDLPVRVMLESDSQSLVECKDVRTFLVRDGATGVLVQITTTGIDSALSAVQATLHLP